MTDAVLGVDRSVTGRRWRPRLKDEALAVALSQRLDLPEVVGRVLAARGVDLDGVETFLNPTLRSALPDPLSLTDMESAAARLADAIEAGQTIGVFGDYDVDGATSSALLSRYVQAVGGGIAIHIPDRIKEGYGPNAPALVRLRDRGAGVVVTVDCGIAAHEPLRLAAEAGIDVIVLDHHMAETDLPRAHAVVNPNRLDDSSGLGQLAAVGVTFMTVVAVNRMLRQRGWFKDRTEPDLMSWLDLVALGTVCDAVPLSGLNRALVTQGLKVLGRRGNTGLNALAEIAGVSETPGAYHAGFVLGPRINAGGRVGQPDLGARLLSTHDADEAVGIAMRLDGFNTERRALEKAVLNEALDQAEAALDSDPSLIVVASESWHPGVIGIVASRLVDRFHRPAVVVSLSDSVGKGSGRSVAGIDLGAAVTAARQAGLLINGGGHPMAAGITVDADRLGDVTAFLQTRLADAGVATGTTPDIGIDGALSAGAATPELVNTVERVGPFGVGNAEPRFAVADARVVRADVVGADHVRCILGGGDGARLKAIAFRAAGTPLGQTLMSAGGAPLHVAGHLRADRWQGREGAQLVVEDVAPAKS